MFDSSNFCFLKAIGGILFPYIKDTKFLKHYQSNCYKFFVKLRQSLEYLPHQEERLKKYKVGNLIAKLKKKGTISCKDKKEWELSK